MLALGLLPSRQERPQLMKKRQPLSVPPKIHQIHDDVRRLKFRKLG